VGISESNVIKRNSITLKDAWAAWLNGEKFAVGFYGDSTTDGVATTDWEASLGHYEADVAAGGVGKADYNWIYSYPYLLQQLIRSEVGSSVPRIYNMGYSGASLENNLSVFPNLLLPAATAVADVKMIGIVMGINDRIHYSTKNLFYKGYVSNLETYINQIYDAGKQPFLVTPQAIVETGATGDGLYPIRTNEAIRSCVVRAMNVMAEKYGLEILDMNEFGNKLLAESLYPLVDITIDKLHFFDLGHKMEADFLFSKLAPNVEKSKNRSKILLGLMNQNAKSDFPSISDVGYTTRYYEDYSGLFKVKINTTKSGTTNVLIYDIYFFNDSGQYTMKFHGDIPSGISTYVDVNGITTAITTDNQTISTLDFGLQRIKVYTGASTKVCFKGIELTKQ
jgi:hypothetical protein